MPIFWWKTAILITKKARYIVPAGIATAGAVIGFLARKLWRKNGKGGKGERAQTAPNPEGKST